MGVEQFKEEHEPEWRRLEALLVRWPPSDRAPSPREIADFLELREQIRAHRVEARARYRDVVLNSYLAGLEERAAAVLRPTAPETTGTLLARVATAYGAGIRRTARFIVLAAALHLVLFLAGFVWASSVASEPVRLLPPAMAAHAQGIFQTSDFDWGSVQAWPLFRHNSATRLLAFGLSLFAGLGAGAAIVLNGLDTGLHAGAFHSLGEGSLWLWVVLPHGPIEWISGWVAWGAGIRLGWAVLNPRYRPRGGGLGAEWRETAMVVLGTAPAVAVAALLEGGVRPLLLSIPAGAVIGAIPAALYVGLLVMLARRSPPVPAPAAAPLPPWFEGAGWFRVLEGTPSAASRPEVEREVRLVSGGQEAFLQVWKQLPRQSKSAIGVLAFRGVPHPNPMVAAFVTGYARRTLTWRSTVVQGLHLTFTAVLLVVFGIPMFAIGGGLVAVVPVWVFLRARIARAERLNLEVVEQALAAFRADAGATHLSPYPTRKATEA